MTHVEKAEELECLLVSTYTKSIFLFKTNFKEPQNTNRIIALATAFHPTVRKYTLQDGGGGGGNQNYSIWR